MIPDAIPIAGLGDDLAVLLFVLKKVWGEVSEDVQAKAQDKLKKWFDEDEIPSADDLFKDCLLYTSHYRRQYQQPFPHVLSGFYPAGTYCRC